MCSVQMKALMALLSNVFVETAALFLALSGLKLSFG